MAGGAGFPGAVVQSKGGTTHTQLHPEGRGEAEEGDYGPSVQFGFSVPHFSAFPGDGRPALRIHIPQIPGGAAPGPAQSRGAARRGHGRALGNAPALAQRHRAVFPDIGTPALLGSPRAWGTPQPGRAPVPPLDGDGQGCDNEQTGYTASTGYSRAPND